MCNNTKEEDIVEKWGLPLKELYTLALKFFKEKEGKAIHFTYDDKLKLVAYTRQVSHGKLDESKLPPLGVFDVIGRDRRLAWQALGDMSTENSMVNFVKLVNKECILFKHTVEAYKADLIEQKRITDENMKKEQEELEKQLALMELKQKDEEERCRQENTKQLIQEALNKQTYSQFLTYAQNQFPNNPDEQAVLVRQLQEQHYHQYMQQLQQNYEPGKELEITTNSVTVPEDKIIEHESICNEQCENGHCLSGECSVQTLFPASMWTRKDIDEFKANLLREGGEAVIKVNHGETVTVRVPTAEGGNCVFWEFATDGHDIGFGVYFEWVKPSSSQVSVHVSESEDDDCDDLEDDDDGNISQDLLHELEQNGVTIKDIKKSNQMNRPPLSIIIPVYRRDCHKEVYAGSHVYPGEGVYLLKFDNSYSLWRSKTLYYRIYYSQ
ncbi:Golgi resident protein GCP60 isoform X1 [Rhopalosiphum padi]|uniref:Golgi resident protein GCP60 isoform X1 n=1 Tax=Rhopalosiphum padi TaxID=40932 RepID=UPI00298E2EE5|nr:Golgi resident protein GCP60 isoform X1 [Rhopalosiphum padi]